MASSSKKKKNTVSLKTFQKWDCHNDFEAEVDDDNCISKLKCKICYTYASQIKEEARKRGLRGQVLSSVLSYAEGVTYIHKNNVSSHVKSGGLHSWAKEKFYTLSADLKEVSATSDPKVVSEATSSSTDKFLKLHISH